MDERERNLLEALRAVRMSGKKNAELSLAEWIIANETKLQLLFLNSAHEAEYQSYNLYKNLLPHQVERLQSVMCDLRAGYWLFRELQEKAKEVLRENGVQK